MGVTPYEQVPIGKLKPMPGNPRRNEAAIGPVAESIKRFGWTSPILARRKDRVVVAGHTRLEAAKRLGLKDVPVRWLDMSATDARLYNLADNKLGQIAEWDRTALAELLRDLQREDAAGLAVAGFGAEEIASILAEASKTDGKTDPDDVPEAPKAKDVYVKPGELYRLGEHRLLCGDSTRADDVARVTKGAEANCVLTDPPYGQSQPGVSGDDPDNLEHVVNGSVAVLPLRNGICVAFQSPRTFPQWLMATRAAGHQHERMLWLHKKAQMAYPWRGWLLKSEAILVSTIGKAAWHEVHPFAHDCYELASVQGELPDGVGWHGSVKPMSVVADILARISTGGALCFEPFSGSGTTLIACEQLGRRCYAMELEPAYVQVAIERWEKFTGKKAERVKT